jgi:hypothetical protein
VLPFAFLDGHVEMINKDDFMNPDRYGPGSVQPLWHLQIW